MMVMALQQHLSPRVIQVQGYSGDPIQISRSILQGCLLSVVFTRIYLLRDISALVRNHPNAYISVHVDDTSFDTAGDTLNDVADICRSDSEVPR